MEEYVLTKPGASRALPLLWQLPPLKMVVREYLHKQRFLEIYICVYTDEQSINVSILILISKVLTGRYTKMRIM